jgi:predicted transcriptional regulator
MDTNHKRAALDLIQAMPEDVSLEEIMYELYFRQRVDRGLEELDQGETLTPEAVKRSLVQWLQSSGQ